MGGGGGVWALETRKTKKMKTAYCISVLFLFVRSCFRLCTVFMSFYDIQPFSGVLGGGGAMLLDCLSWVSLNSFFYFSDPHIKRVFERFFYARIIRISDFIE